NLTARLQGSETMYVQIDANGGDPMPALRHTPGVTGVVEADRNADIVGYEVVSERGRDIRRDLARTIVAANWGLLELRPMRMSLEEIFLSLTTEDLASQPAAAEMPVGEVVNG